MLCSLTFLSISISNILNLFDTKNFLYEELIKMIVLFIFGLFAIYGAIKEINPKFKPLKALFKLTIKEQYIVDVTLGLSIILAVTIFILYSTISGVLLGEIIFYSPVYQTDWVNYKNEPYRYFGSVMIHVLISSGLIYFWLWKIKSFKNEKSNNAIKKDV